jgi:hypothetical protein
MTLTPAVSLVLIPEQHWQLWSAAEAWLMERSTELKGSEGVMQRDVFASTAVCNILILSMHIKPLIPLFQMYYCN